MSDDSGVKSDMSVALDIKALSQRIRDLELFPEMGFRAEFSAISDDMRSTASALASHNRELAKELESIAEDMIECCAGDRWDRDDFRDAVISDLEEFLRRMSTKEQISTKEGNS